MGDRGSRENLQGANPVSQSERSDTSQEACSWVIQVNGTVVGIYLKSLGHTPLTVERIRLKHTKNGRVKVEGNGFREGS